MLKMPATRRVSLRQLEILIEAMECNRNIALGRFTGGPQAARASREIWANLALKLSAVADGATKSPEQWRRYWIEYKAKTKAKAADSRRMAVATGGGPNKILPLTPIEERVLGLIGSVAVEGLSGVRVPISTETIPPTTLSHIPSSNLISPENTLLPEQSCPPDYEFEVECTLDDLTSSPLPLSLPSTATEDTQATSHSAEQQPADVPREETGRESSRKRTRRTRQIRKNPTVPRWAYDLEMRRIAAEERHAAAMEQIVQLMQNIRDDLNCYLTRTA